MRGKEFRAVPAGGLFRITPAYAGKSRISVIYWELLWDHPRLCGEKKICSISMNRSTGITPAYAGKSRNR